MSDHYDRLETRSPITRETALFRDLRHVLGVAKARVPSLRAQLKGIDIPGLLSRADLADIPVLREADLAAFQTEQPPFGGLAAARGSSLKQVFAGLGSICALEGQAKDWWGAGRALFAAGLRRGSLAFNCFSYDLVPDGHMIESGANAMCAPVLPAGNAALDAKVDAMARHHPVFFAGPAGHLKELLDHAADRHVDPSLTLAMVTGPMSAGLRSELGLRGLAVRLVSINPQVGVVAFESGAVEGLIVNEGLIVEIVDPVTAKPVPAGTDGEIVVSRINADYPLLRFATGEISSLLPQPSPCGRTNMRIRVPRRLERVDKVRVGPTHLREIRHHHPSLGRMCLILRRPRGHDVVHLKAENGDGTEALDRVSETLHLVTRMRGTVEFVEPGTLADDDGAIVDERSLN